MKKNNIRIDISIEQKFDDYAMVASTLSNNSVCIILKVNSLENLQLKGFFGTENISEIINDVNFTSELFSTNGFQEKNINIASYNYCKSYTISNNDDQSLKLIAFNKQPNKLSENQKLSFITIAEKVSEAIFLTKIVKQDEPEEKEKFYENCLTENNIGLWELNVSTAKFKLNEIALNILGYKNTDDLDFNFDNFLEIVYEKHVGECLMYLNKIKNKEIEKYEHTIRVKHNKGYWSWTTIQARVTKWNEQKEPILIEGCIVNIHDAYTMKMQLNSIIEYVNCLAFRYIIFEDGTEEIIHLTNGSEKISGFTKEEISSDVSCLWNSVHEDDIDKLRLVIGECATEHKDWNEEFRMYHHLDGSIRWIRGFGKTIVNHNGSVSIDTVIADITEDKNRNKELEYLNGKLNQAQNIAKLGYFEIDYINHTEYWSDKIYAIYGLEKTVKRSRETLIPLFSKEDLELIYAKRDESIKLNKEFKLENKIKRPDGKLIWVQHIGNFLKNKKGELIKFECTVQDITATKSIELALEESIERYNYVMNATSDAIWDLDFLKGKLYWGENYKKLFGHPSLNSAEDDLKYWGDNIHPEDRKRVIDSFDNILESDENNWKEEYRFANSKKEYLYVIDRGFVIRDNKGKPIRMVGAIQDVTDKLKATEEIKWSNERFEKIAEATNDAIWEWDFINNKVYQGPGYYKLFGNKPKNALNAFEVWKSKVHPDDLPKVIDSIKLSTKGNKEEFFKNEYRFLKSDGEYANVNCRGSVIYDNNGDAVRVLGATADVTDKLKAIEQIKQSNERFEKVTKATSDAIYDIDFVSGKIFRGQNYEKLFGYDSIAMITDDIDYWEDNIHPNDRKRVVDGFQLSLIEGGEIWEDEYRFKNIKNEYSYVIDKALFVRDNKGVVVRMVGAIKDVTDQLKAVEDIKRSNERFENITKATSDAIYDIDFETEEIFRGENYKKLFGYTEEIKNNDTAKGDYWESNIHPDDREKIVDSCNESLKSEQLTWQEEYRFKNSNNEYLHVIDKAFFVRDNKGVVVRMVGAIQDITDKINAIEEIRRSNERFEKISEATNDAIWDFDLITNEVVYGASHFKLFGYKNFKEQDGFNTWKKRVHPDDVEAVSLVIEDRLGSRSSDYFNLNYRYLKSDGTYAYVIDRGSVLRNGNGEPVKLVGALQDITDRKKYEDSLKELNENLKLQATELSRYNEELEQFAYVVSHDLQEPLRMISSFLTLLEKKYNDTLDADGKKYIHFAVDGAKRMRQIILDLLDFSRVGRSDEVLEELDLNMIMTNINVVFQQEIENKNAIINSQNLPKINSYKILIQQLFQNLIGNALKYQKEGKVPVININYENLKTHHKFIIEDNGIGIKEDYFDKIFVIFQRLHGKNKFNGTGIGLALAKKIIENLEGEIWVESELDVGSKFFFTIKKK